MRRELTVFLADGNIDAINEYLHAKLHGPPWVSRCYRARAPEVISAAPKQPVHGPLGVTEPIMQPGDFLQGQVVYKTSVNGLYIIKLNFV